MTNATTKRIASIDIFRALTMFFMIFVNDIPGLREIPHWLRHAASTEDMLGFSDLIFPGFLFAMGISIPFAIEKRFEKGDSLLQVLRHIAERTIALLVMGVFLVNTENMDGASMPISGNWFNLLLILAFFLIWNVYPKADKPKKYIFLSARTAGAAILVFLFLIYKGMDGAAFGPQWWGILGLIGWTYLVSAVTYLITRRNLSYICTAWLLFLTLAVGTHAETFSLPFIPSDMTLHALGVSGVFTSVLLSHYTVAKQPRNFIILLCGIGVVMFIAFLATHNYWIISKIQATPSWLFACTALFFPLFGLVYWLTDIKGKTDWFALIKPAGTATLTCYLIPYIWYNVQGLLGWNYPAFLGAGIPGLIKSLVFSLIIVQITGLLVKGGIRLKV